MLAVVRFPLAFATLAALLGAPAPAAQEPAGATQPPRAFYGGDAAFPPYEYLDANGEPRGETRAFSCDLAARTVAGPSSPTNVAIAGAGPGPGALLSVNMSARQLHGRELVEQVRAVLLETGLAPQQNGLEITETVAIRDQAPRCDAAQSFLLARPAPLRGPAAALGGVRHFWSEFEARASGAGLSS